MAAVTVEDCLKIIPNRFELSLIVSYRAKQLMNGAPMLYESKKKEKYTIIALREIGKGLLDIEQIREELKTNLKDQDLFKSFDDDLNPDNKKDSDLDNVSLDDDLNDELEDSDDFDVDISDDEDDYYNDLDTDVASDELDD